MLNIKDLKDKINYNKYCIVPKLKQAGEYKIAEQIEHCSETSIIATCIGCGTTYFSGVYTCKSRYCAVCARMRAMAWLCKLVPLLEEYRKKGYKLFMLNLTIKDNDNLKYILDKLMQSWRIMTHDDKISRKHFKVLNNGGIRSVEIKLGKFSGQWHPHIHSIVLLKTDKKVTHFQAYKELWEHATGLALQTTEKVGSIDIRGLKGYDGDVINAVVETFKYITKFDWLKIENEKISEMFKATHKRRFISAWGILYGINKQVDDLLGKYEYDDLKKHTCKICGCTVFELENILTEALSESLDILTD